MASNGDKVTSTIENAGGLSTGENPKKIVDLNTTEPEPDLADDGILDGEDKGLSSSGEKKESITIGTTAGPESPVDNIQKKIRRAERFGVSVKLTEEEKRNSRAERFGTVAATGNDTEGTKKSEELKRKSRADRFGVPAATPTADKTEEDAKKKARLARFGEDTKVVSAANKTEEDAKKKARLARFGETTKVDSAEEDKRKARGLRFSKETSDTSSDLPGKQSINKEAAVSGNAA